MAEEPVNIIRETSRNQLFLNRRKQKDEVADVRRSLGNLQINLSDVTAIANKLKTKAFISTFELKSLQNALADDPKGIEIVLNTHGALRGLVRELTGHDVNKQIASCGCLCNLALGESKACCIIAKAAGAYLVAALDNMTCRLAETCAWTLGNLAGSGARACDVILAQGALAKLCDVMHGDVCDAAIYALSHIAYVLKDDLTADHLYKIVQSLSQTEINMDTSYLLFILSCHIHFTPEMIPEVYLHKIVEKFTVSMEHHLNICKATKKIIEIRCCDFIYIVRILANMNSSHIYYRIIEYFMKLSDLVQNNVRKLLIIDEDKSLWWLLGNMLNQCGDSEFLSQTLCHESLYNFK